MASSQQSNQVKQPEASDRSSELFDQETREKSPDALLSLLTHLKRQDEEASNK